MFIRPYRPGTRMEAAQSILQSQQSSAYQFKGTILTSEAPEIHLKEYKEDKDKYYNIKAQSEEDNFNSYRSNSFPETSKFLPESNRNGNDNSANGNKIQMSSKSIISDQKDDEKIDLKQYDKALQDKKKKQKKKCCFFC